jgi:hypothetical protein
VECLPPPAFRIGERGHGPPRDMARQNDDQSRRSGAATRSAAPRPCSCALVMFALRAALRRICGGWRHSRGRRYRVLRLVPRVPGSATLKMAHRLGPRSSATNGYGPSGADAVQHLLRSAQNRTRKPGRRDCEAHLAGAIRMPERTHPRRRDGVVLRRKGSSASPANWLASASAIPEGDLRVEPECRPTGWIRTAPRRR